MALVTDDDGDDDDDDARVDANSRSIGSITDVSLVVRASVAETGEAARPEL